MKRKPPRIRRSWGGLNPATRVHEKSKRRGYDRQAEKQRLRKEKE